MAPNISEQHPNPTVEQVNRLLAIEDRIAVLRVEAHGLDFLKLEHEAFQVRCVVASLEMLREDWFLENGPIVERKPRGGASHG